MAAESNPSREGKGERKCLRLDHLNVCPKKQTLPRNLEVRRQKSTQGSKGILMRTSVSVGTLVRTASWALSPGYQARIGGAGRVLCLVSLRGTDQ